MLVELGVVEQRYDAVKEVLDGGGTVTKVAERYGVTRQSLRKLAAAAFRSRSQYTPTRIRCIQVGPASGS